MTPLMYVWVALVIAMALFIVATLRLEREWRASMKAHDDEHARMYLTVDDVDDSDHAGTI